MLNLADCGIPAIHRFAFYDQVHTTGMDIQQLGNQSTMIPAQLWLLIHTLLAQLICIPYDSIMMVIHPFVRHKRDCVGAITLGKDMVFRDYAQGAYRLRGIGKGQKLRILIIPETCQ